jgi:putative NIF3 family GTP cyclohydrolase 1 type 2
VQQVAIACGAAGEYLPDAARLGADVFLTGEMRFHALLAARSMGVSLVLPGHYATERFGIVALASRLKQAFPSVLATASNVEADPAAWV